MNPQEHIPPQLEHLKHYFESERLEWAQTLPGTEVVVETEGAARQLSYLSFRLLCKEPIKAGLHDVWVELGEQDYEFVNASTRETVKLPAGTIMKGGISAQHFPRTSLLMAYYGGISTDRDYSFDEVLTPDGQYLDGVLVGNVKKLFSFASESEFDATEILAKYKEVISEKRATDNAAQAEFEAELDNSISEITKRLFSDADCQELIEIISTFHPEGRYRLYCLIEHSEHQELIPAFLPALKKVMNDEFGWDMPGWRGYPALPASSRGWSKIIQEIGLKRPQ